MVGLEESLANERKKMQEEIDEKLKIITDLSKQLEVHQKNFEALKHELSQVINLGHSSRPSLQIVIGKLKKRIRKCMVRTRARYFVQPQISLCIQFLNEENIGEKDTVGSFGTNV